MNHLSDIDVGSDTSSMDISAQRNPAKRQKIPIACNICKSRKSKCDGARPICGPCSRRRGGRGAHMCAYRAEPTPDGMIQQRPCRSATANGDTSLLSPAVQNVDNHTAENDQSNIPAPSSNPVYDPSVRFTENDTDDAIRHSRAPSDGSASDRDVDAMGCVDPWALRSGLLGAASGASFTRQIWKAAEGINTPDPGARGSRSDHVTTKLTTLRTKRKAENDYTETQLVLPKRDTSDHLFEVYWNYSDPIFPWLDEAEVRRHYEGLWTPNNTPDLDEKVFYCTLNLMFAIAAKLDPLRKPETRTTLANAYYGRARDLLSFNLLDISHFQILQNLLLATQYLQSTNMPRQCFQILGLAIWVAQDLGLHLPETTSLLEKDSERELARRIWHGCILMDKIAAMTFGRPARIPKAVADNAPYPRASGSASPSALATSQHTEQPAKLDFFIAFCDVHQILGDVLDNFYSKHDSSRGSGRNKAGTLPTLPKLEQVFELDQNLSGWWEKLPSHLKTPLPSFDNTETRYITRQANILQARYLYLRLLLFRPFFTQKSRLDQATTMAGISSLESRATALIVNDCQYRCVQAAQSIVDLVANSLTTMSQSPQQDVLPSWWFTISYIFTSCLVLLAALMVPSILETFPAVAIQTTLDRGLQVLQHYDAHTKSAKRCSSMVRNLRRKITGPRPAGQVAPTQSSYNTQQAPSQISNELLGSLNESMGNDSLGFCPVTEDFSWLETDMLFWDDELTSLGSLDANGLEAWS